MVKLTFNKFFNKLNITEQRAYLYLTAKGTKIKIQNTGRLGMPDFEDEDNKKERGKAGYI